jgi:biotin synthase-related radical SAM superfamily protein
MMRVSIGTAIELGLVGGKADVASTTAYFMVGEKCHNACSFCSQSKEAASSNKLSRVTWPPFTKTVVLEALGAYKGQYLKRICLQVLGSEESIEESKALLKALRDLPFPVSVSVRIRNEQDADTYFSLGAERLGVAIDAVNEKQYSQIKGGKLETRVQLIKTLALKYPGKISTHIIVGLGETHEEIAKLYDTLHKLEVNISLFAFTPVRGTKLENEQPPTIESYRRVQMMCYLLKHALMGIEDFTFEDGYLVNFKPVTKEVYRIIQAGEPFKTHGCKDCNRPYYNDTPGGTIYNYAKELEMSQSEKALVELNLSLIVQ